METVESCYDREGGVAWGPITREEILDNFERRKKKKVTRRQTVNSLPSFDDKKLRTIYEKKSDKKRNILAKSDNSDEPNTSVIIISTDDDDDDVFDEQDRSLSDVTEEHSKDIDTAHLEVKTEMEDYTEDLINRSTLNFEDDLSEAEEDEQIGSNSGIKRLSTPPQSLETRLSRAKHILTKDDDINIPEIRIIPSTPNKRYNKSNETLEDRFEDQIDLCNDSFSIDENESEIDVIDLGDSDDDIMLATSPVAEDLNKSSVYTRTKDRQPTPANVDESTFNETFESCEDQKVEVKLASEGSNPDISMNIEHAEEVKSILNDSSVEIESLNISEDRDSISNIDNISTRSNDDEFEENKSNIVLNGSTEVEDLNDSSSSNVSTTNVFTCQEEEENIVSLINTSKVNDSSNIPNVVDFQDDKNIGLLNDPAEEMEKLNISENKQTPLKHLNISETSFTREFEAQYSFNGSLNISQGEEIVTKNLKNEYCNQDICIATNVENSSILNNSNIVLNDTTEEVEDLNDSSSSNVSNVSTRNDFVSQEEEEEENIVSLINTLKVNDSSNIPNVVDFPEDKNIVSLNDPAEEMEKLNISENKQTPLKHLNISETSFTREFEAQYNASFNRSLSIGQGEEIAPKNLKNEYCDQDICIATNVENKTSSILHDSNIVLNDTTEEVDDLNDSSSSNVSNVSTRNDLVCQEEEENIVSLINTSKVNDSSNIPNVVDFPEDKNIVSLNDPAEEMEELNISKNKHTPLKHLNISETSFTQEFEAQYITSFNRSLSISQGEEIVPKNLKNEYCDQDICIATNVENKTSSILHDSNIVLNDTIEEVDDLNDSSSSNVSNVSTRNDFVCQEEENIVSLINTSKLNDSSNIPNVVNFPEDKNIVSLNDPAEEMEELNISKNKHTLLKHLNISETSFTREFEAQYNTSFNRSLSIGQGGEIVPKNLKNEYCDQDICIATNVENKISSILHDSNIVLNDTTEEVDDLNDSSSSNVSNVSTRNDFVCQEEEENIVSLINTSKVNDSSNIPNLVDFPEDKNIVSLNDPAEEMEELNISKNKHTPLKHLNISETSFTREFEAQYNTSFNRSLSICQGEEIVPKNLKNEYCDQDICIATNVENKTSIILDDSLEVQNVHINDSRSDCSPKHLPYTEDARFNDTLEEMERLLNEGLDYSMQTDVDTKSDIVKLQIAEDIPKILKTPQRHIHQIKSNSASKLNQNKGAISKKILKSDIKKPCIPIFTHSNKPIPKLNLTPNNKFLTPNTKQLSTASTPKITKNRFRDIESPISIYIKNSGKTPLIKNVNPKNSLSCEKIKTQPIKKTDTENSIIFPEVIYKPAKSTVVAKETCIKLPKKIESLIPQRMNVVKHIGRVRGTHVNTSISRKLLEGDLTIDSNSSLNTTKDISIVHKKDAFIT